MADEININVNLSNNNGNQRVIQSPTSRTLDQTNQGSASVTSGVGVTNSTISFGLTNPGYCFAENLETSGTNSISIGSSSGEYILQLYPNEFALFPLESGATVNVQASAANTTLYIQAIER